MARVNLELPDELLARVDEAAGDIPRNRWIRRAIDMALSNPAQLRQHRDPSMESLRRADAIIRAGTKRAR